MKYLSIVRKYENSRQKLKNSMFGHQLLPAHSISKILVGKTSLALNKQGIPWSNHSNHPKCNPLELTSVQFCLRALSLHLFDEPLALALKTAFQQQEKPSRVSHWQQESPLWKCGINGQLISHSIKSLARHVQNVHVKCIPFFLRQNWQLKNISIAKSLHFIWGLKKY